MGYPAASMAGSEGPAAPVADPMELLQAAADLANPLAAARQAPWLAGELLKIALGRSELEFGPRDPRFADTTWRENPAFRLLGQSYRLFEEWTGRMADAVEGPWDRQARARYLASILAATASPANFLPTNPAALKRAFETGGLSVLRGG